MITKEIIDRALIILDIQRKHAVNAGAKPNTCHLFINSDCGGDQEQNSYYNGNMNVVEAILHPDYYLYVDNKGKHYIEKAEA